jgi:hypothetical protein
MAKWETVMDGTSIGSYSLSKEYSPDWFVSVFRTEGKWSFRFGRRPSAGKGEESYSTSQKFTSPKSAQTKALVHLAQKTFLVK